MRVVLAIVSLVFLGVSAVHAEPSLPPPIDLVQKRDQLFGAYPEFPEENAMSALRRYGNAISRYEQQVIGGWQREIEQRCRQTKDFERHVSRNNQRGELSPNAFSEHQEAIAAERELCDVKNKDSSPLWQLEAELRAMNSQRFAELQDATAICVRNDKCRES